MKKSPMTCITYKSFLDFLFLNLNDIRASNPTAYLFDRMDKVIVGKSRVVYYPSVPPGQLTHPSKYLKLKEGGWGHLVVGYTFKQYDITEILNHIYDTYKLNDDNKKLLTHIMRFPYLKIQYDNSKRTLHYDTFFSFMTGISTDVTYY
jgi:hypothetical protein